MISRRGVGRPYCMRHSNTTKIFFRASRTSAFAHILCMCAYWLTLSVLLPKELATKLLIKPSNETSPNHNSSRLFPSFYVYIMFTPTPSQPSRGCPLGTCLHPHFPAVHTKCSRRWSELVPLPYSYLAWPTPYVLFTCHNRFLLSQILLSLTI